MKLFVYGTLKRGHGNYVLLAGSKFLQEDAVKGRLYTSRPHGGLPFLLPGEELVRGEVFEIDEALLHRLDALEGHPHWYTREVRTLESGLQASVYVYNHEDHIKTMEFSHVPSGVFGPSQSWSLKASPENRPSSTSATGPKC